MKKLTVLMFASLLISLFGGAVALWAADFWQTKPFTDWDQKEAQKVLTDSPWAKKLSISLPGNPQSTGKGGGGRGGRGGGGPAGESADPGISGGGAPGIAETAGGGGGRGGGFGAGSGDTGVTQAPALPLLVSFRSALPLREAMAKLKYGAEAGTSPEAKKMLEDKIYQEYYIVAVAGLPTYVQPHDNDDKKRILIQTLLSAKGKDSLTAMDVQFSMDGRNVDAYFLFPRTTEFTANDKDVEFDTKVGGLAIKDRFNLKNMVINGKLEM
jgi:hypothetical protein